MYAVIETGGKQYRVTEDQVFEIEKLTAEPGETVTFEKVLMVTDGDNVKLGAPFIEGMQVHGEVVEQFRDKKVISIKFRRRKHHMKTIGHRQYLTTVKITGIGGAPKASKKAAAKAETGAEPKTKKVASKKTKEETK